MKIEKLNHSKFKYLLYTLILGVVLIFIIIFQTSRAAYRTTQSINIAHGTINYKMPDLNILAVKVQKDETSTDESNYDSADSIPTGSYELNTTKSYCTYSNNGVITNIDANMSYDSETGIVNINIDISKKGTKCYLYFDIYISSLPSEYTELKYIETSGTQYINTNIIPTYLTSFKFKSIVLLETKFYGTLLGSTDSDDGPKMFMFRLYSNFPIIEIQRGNTSGKIMRGVDYGDEYFIEGGISTLSVDKQTTEGLNNFSGESTYPLWLFDGNFAGLPWNRGISCKCGEVIIENDGIIVRDYYPAKRNIDDVIGMYDIVSNTFFTNSGTGEFIAGPEI